MAHFRKKSNTNAKNFADIFYTSQVITNSVPNFVALATGVNRG